MMGSWNRPAPLRTSWWSVALLFLCIAVAPAQRTRHTVIIVIDGPRYTETFGDTAHRYIPYMWNELRPQGTIYTNFYNNGVTFTIPGHSSILSGVWENIENDGNERAHHPTIFEYYRSQNEGGTNDCWVSLGKMKLKVLAYSDHTSYGQSKGASIRYVGDDLNDRQTMENVQYALQQRSRLTIANFAKTDVEGHDGNYQRYLSALTTADSLVAVLWRWIRSDDSLRSTTTLIVTNDHGRHTDDFVNHGDGCEGCRHNMLMVLGPDTPRGVVDSTLCSQIDIAPTIGELMRFRTPLVQGLPIPSVLAAAPNIPLSFSSAPGPTVSGSVPLTWSHGAVKESVVTILEFRRHDRDGWHELKQFAPNETTYLWNTSGLADGARYQLRLRVLGDTLYGIAVSAVPFTIDNAENGAPDLRLLSPPRAMQIAGPITVRWDAADAEGSTVSIALFGSTDQGKHWSPIAAGLPNTGSYEWNSATAPNSSSFLLKVTASDGSASTSVESPPLEMKNPRVRNTTVRQVQGEGNGTIIANICAPAELRSTTYRLRFSIGPSNRKTYSVFDAATELPLLSAVPISDDGAEGPLFDGVRLIITDPAVPTVQNDSVRWLIGSSSLTAAMMVPELKLPEGTIRGFPEPSDYEVRISSVVQDTSTGDYGTAPIPLYYSIYNTSRQRKVPVMVVELNEPGVLSPGDDLYLFGEDSTGKRILTWELFLNGVSGAPLPKPGDVLRLKTFKPITAADVVEFSSSALTRRRPEGNPGAFTMSQNYPNPFNPVSLIDVWLPEGGTATLAVYDILGRRIEQRHETRSDAGTLRFRFDGSRLGSGMYLYRVDVRTALRNWSSSPRTMLLLK